ncbi:MAG: acyltransferase family protein [Ilumatobacteraceae bacterium]
MTENEHRSITYQPALDGLRGVAVTLVLLFHLGLSWMSGGYLGVSVFFTLSGFLITTLLVTELQNTGDIRLGRFYGRRARRLLPASLVCLAGACILIALELTPDRSGLRWYIFGGLFQFANWVPLGLHNSYAELFSALSPTDHFWSLAIEEQFYWLWPLSMLGLFRLLPRRRHRTNADGDRSSWTGRLLRILIGLFVLFGISAPLTAHLWNADAAYFATWARIPEILAGAVLAVIAFRMKLPRWVAWLAPLALAAIIVLSIISPSGSGFAYQGALPLFSLVSAALIAGVQRPSATTTLLSQRPIVYIGKISYGLYLYHWPVFVVLTPQRTGWSTLPLSVLRLAITVAITIVSYVLIEQPIRTRRMLPRPRLAAITAALAIPLVAVLGIVQVSNTSASESTSGTLSSIEGTIAPLVTAPAPTTATTTAAPITPSSATTTVPSDITSDITSGNTSETVGAVTVPTVAPAITVASTTTVATTTTIALTPTRPVRILVIGDSTALAMSVGLKNWADANPSLAEVEVRGVEGCGLMTDGDRRFGGDWLPQSQGCTDVFDTDVPKRIGAGQPDIVVVILSFWEVTDHRLGPDQAATSILDPDYRARMLFRYTAYNQGLIDTGVPRVTWVLYPETDYGWGADNEEGDDPARYDALDDVTREAAAPYPGVVSTIDFRTWSARLGLTDDQSARLDGVHFTPDAATRVANDFLGNAIIQAALH